MDLKLIDEYDLYSQPLVIYLSLDVRRFILLIHAVEDQHHQLKLDNDILLPKQSDIQLCILYVNQFDIS